MNYEMIRKTRNGKLKWNGDREAFSTQVGSISFSLSLEEEGPTLFISAEHGDTDPNVETTSANSIRPYVIRLFSGDGIEDEFKDALNAL